MSLTAGTQLGPYRVLTPLGAGGMGEVYRAHDARLGRDVAIKVLPSHLAGSPAARARFEREARTVSQLNDPHICALFDVGREGDTDYLVMELLEGETLSQRLERGPLPLVEVLTLGAQIAKALGRAHQAGVVHRDLKPSNVMLTKNGPKLMDFGLARSMVEDGRGEGSESPTRPLTSQGTIVGTLQYMSPEQLERQDADARSDLWAMGCLLYEMATGKAAFEGTSQASLIATILKEEPRSMTELQPLVPAALQHLVARCLTKDPGERFQSASDLAFDLRNLVGKREGVSPGAPRRGWATRRALHVGAILVALVLGVAVGVTWHLRGGAAGLPRAARLCIQPPPGMELSPAAHVSSLALSADGMRIAFCARQGEGPRMLCVRSLDGDDAHLLAGTEGALSPFFSPDGRSIGFFVGDELKRVDVAGGPVLTLAKCPLQRGGTWGKDVIIFAPDQRGPLLAVPAGGGATVAVTAVDSTRNENTHRYPQFLPDHRHFLYLARGREAGQYASAVYVGSLDSSARVKVLDVESNVAYASGRLLFVRQGTLMAQPFDERRLRLTGDAEVLAERARWDARFSIGDFAVSQNGLLALSTGEEDTRAELRWIGRDGGLSDPIGPPAEYYGGGYPQIAPDGRRAAISIVDPERGTTAVWNVDLETGERRRFTADGRSLGSEYAWSPDGTKLAVDFGGGGVPAGVEVIPIKGVGAPVVWPFPDGLQVGALSWTPDSRYVLFSDYQGKVHAHPLVGDDEPPVVQLSASLGSFHVSPDGHFICFDAKDSGRWEVYVASFPGAEHRWQVSSAGGGLGQWSPDGKEIFFFDYRNWMFAVDVRAFGTTFELGTAHPLFQLSYLGGFDVSPDGSRFLVSVPVRSVNRAIDVVTNWPALMGKDE